MKIEINIPDDIIRDYIGRANINYWGDAEWVADRFIEKPALRIREHEPDKGTPEGWRVLTREDFARGIAILAARYQNAFKDLIADTGDMYTGDLLIQCAAFGEEKYA